MMGRFYEVGLLSLLIFSLLNTESTLAKKGSSSSGKKTSSTKWGGTKTSSSQPGNYPRQPQNPNRNPNPYPPGGSYPGTGNTNPGGYPRQNPSNPGAGGYPHQNPGGYPPQNPGGYPPQNPGGYPHQNPGGYPHQNPGGYPPQNPGGYPAGGYPAGGYPAGGYPAGGGYPQQNPGRGNYPNQYPPAGGYPAGGNNPNQYPGRGGYPNQYPAGGSYPNTGRNYPNQYPAGGGFPAAGGYPNQYPGRGGGSPYQYPGGGGYPIRTGSTGQGWGAPGAGGYPYGGGVGGYPNWNPNNKILSPRFGGGGYGYGGYGSMGGSPFSRSVQSMGYQPKSTGFAKKAMLAAGVGAVAGMAVGYGLGRFPRPHFSFNSPQEEYYYNNYMYNRYGTKSTDQKDYGRDYVYKPPPRAESYEDFMKRCMNRTDLKEQGSSSSTAKAGADEEDNDTVSIEEIGYPALIDQVKSRRCVEMYMAYSEQFMQEKKFEPHVQQSPNSSPTSFGVVHLFTSCLVLLSSMLLLQ